MQMIHPSTRQKQALLVAIFFTGIVLTFFATKAWGLDDKSVDRSIILNRSTVAQSVEPFKLERSDQTTTTTTTTTTTSARHEGTAAPKVIAPQITVPPTGDVWERLRKCESHGDYAINTGNGYYGAYQFSAGTWDSMGTGYAYAHEAPPEVQDDAARRLQARSGWGQWPVCAKGFPQP